MLRREAAQIELWAGVEPTVNRVGERYFDQLERTGHAARRSDLALIAQLGIRTLRYPVLWERTAPDGLSSANWLWSDDRLAYLRELGIRPIVGLVHHGSGPRYTSLVDPSMPEKLAEYAAAVARRYPWVLDYTPINEPLTTARFSGLYGHWYPHGRDNRTFTQALLGQCRAVVLAMGAIREVTPGARLVQTDDLGKIFATPELQYQADFENERRWLSWDLLCGRVDRTHALWPFLVEEAGAKPSELEWFLDNPCPPTIVGLNHYLSSERFLDEDLTPYEPECRGGNGRHHYADVLALRVAADGVAGPGSLLREAWQRFGIPVAITEAHNGCTREEQLRWLVEVWDQAAEARADGVDVRAVTAWSLLGAFDWDSLVTAERGTYHAGAFDVRAPEPRRTALADALVDLAAGHRPQPPTLASPGWWRRPERLLYPRR
ncbi:MAG: family 1 glycosylhydrolase, partial [Chloroflexota bacterium]|nr:family 1 glycosylhydrolase [Chloroflexota bacterium]